MTERFETTKMALLGVLHNVDISNATVEWIENRYWPCSKEYDELRSPWLRVTTPHGPIVLGWRKRVIHIEWQDTNLDVNGKDAVAEEWITHGDRMCHAWSYTQAAACLERLFNLQTERGHVVSTSPNVQQVARPSDTAVVKALRCLYDAVCQSRTTAGFDDPRRVTGALIEARAALDTLSTDSAPDFRPRCFVCGEKWLPSEGVDATVTPCPKHVWSRTSDGQTRATAPCPKHEKAVTILGKDSNSENTLIAADSNSSYEVYPWMGRWSWKYTRVSDGHNTVDDAAADAITHRQRERHPDQTAVLRKLVAEIRSGDFGFTASRTDVRAIDVEQLDELISELEQGNDPWTPKKQPG